VGVKASALAKLTPYIVDKRQLLIDMGKYYQSQYFTQKATRTH